MWPPLTSSLVRYRPIEEWPDSERNGKQPCHHGTPGKRAMGLCVCVCVFGGGGGGGGGGGLGRAVDSIVMSMRRCHWRRTREAKPASWSGGTLRTSALGVCDKDLGGLHVNCASLHHACH